MSSSQYPSDVQFAGLIQAATAAADAQQRNGSILGKRVRSEDDSVIDTQLRVHPDTTPRSIGQLQPNGPILQNSASVLFREPSEKSKKYSRPPLGKVYTDLELLPDTFLHLQNAAKRFMLDENHMERRDVVGNKKHSGNNDVAKLKLWECVEEFLDSDDNGEKWFGHMVDMENPNAPQRTFWWPEDKQRITKLCMPLFRKMVTNERQRLYASETRKQEANRGDRNKKIGTAEVQSRDASTTPQAPVDEVVAIDHKLVAAPEPQDAHAATFSEQHSTNSTDHIILHVNVVSTNNGSTHRVAPKFSVPSETLTTLSRLFSEIRSRYDIPQINATAPEGRSANPVVKMWLSDGLSEIRDDAQWTMALLDVSLVDWMDSEVRVLVEV